MTSAPGPIDPSAITAAASLHAAREQLRDRSRQRSVEIADNVLRNALRSSRHSLPVKVAAPHDYVRISDQVIIILLRRAIDSALDGAAVGRINLKVDRNEKLHELVIELFVQYGRVLLDVADQARSIADVVLARLLLAGSHVTVDVVTSHVHISDITVGDPHLVDPQDERGH
jgi:hypothetical protein